MQTFVFTTDAIGADEPIVVQSPGGCTRIVLSEDAAAATAGFKLRVPLSTSAQVTYPAGAVVELRNEDHPGKPRFAGGQTVGFISALSGSLSIAQVEY